MNVFTRLAPLEIVPQPEALIRWQDTPAVAAYLAAIDIDELALCRPMVVMGDDLLHFTGDPVEQLTEMRREVIDALFGCTFREANASGRAYEYLDFEAQHDSVDAVLAAVFGDPHLYGNEHYERATQMMRCGVRLAAAQQRHGLGRAA